MSIDHLAFDIETVPAIPLAEYSETVQAKVYEKIERGRERNPDYDYNYFASIHGDFGKVICISLGYVTREGGIKLKSIYGDDEAQVLTEFNEAIAKTGRKFIHYNGLGFDVPFLLQRLAHHGIRLSNSNFADLRKYSTQNHFDLMMVYYNWDLYRALPLGILAELHHIPSPKEDLSGGKVYAAYKAGEWERIAHYCEFDVATTLNLWNKIYRHRPVIDVSGYRFSSDLPE